MALPLVDMAPSVLNQAAQNGNMLLLYPAASGRVRATLHLERPIVLRFDLPIVRAAELDSDHDFCHEILEPTPDTPSLLGKSAASCSAYAIARPARTAKLLNC